MIRRGMKRDIDAVERHYEELFTFEEKRGSRTNWKRGVYPTRSVAEKGVEDGTLYVMEEDGKLCASMILNQVQLESYASIPWLYPAEPDKVLVIHTLCVPPSQAGRGVGSGMVRFALEEGARRGCEVMRLDTWENNEPAANMYRRLGFRYAGKSAVLFADAISENLIFLERRILEPEGVSEARK
ncbi:GNAT family N-acetyltransferase [uncultured Mailhella sp.]|uniref:GNAT family N-acetyltransferase n=1 Tax=uncultured Mailhella sp. TaxID=1981031 RepID=UPI0025D4E3BE|nr:GNAT family N-acetyltransferase [uncultured Mailhella sp.]